jgi:hypothetical protein
MLFRYSSVIIGDAHILYFNMVDIMEINTTKEIFPQYRKTAIGEHGDLFIKDNTATK